MTATAPAVPSTWPADITVVGLGIAGAHQVTREAEEVLRRCNHAFVIASGFGLVEYVESLCARVTDLGALYRPGMNRMLTYHRMAADVVAAAMVEAPVCLATYGHPLVYCYPTTLLSRAAPALGLRFEAYAGVSAFDTLLVDLGVDIAASGVQMYEATDLLMRRRPLQADVACIVWQPTVVGDPTCPDGPYAESQFEPLRDYLLTFYPPSHEVRLVTSKNHPLLRSTVEPFPLARLATVLSGTPGVGTLFIPPVADRPVEDPALLELMVTAGAIPDPAWSGSETGRFVEE